jgi:hypothetical protein
MKANVCDRWLAFPTEESQLEENNQVLAVCQQGLQCAIDEFLRFSGKTTDPSHLLNPAESEIRNLRENMRQRAEKEFLPLEEISEQEV